MKQLATGSINADKFMDFIRGRLIPNMQPFPAKHSILILDNCSIHHAHDVTTLLSSFGILVLFHVCTSSIIIICHCVMQVKQLSGGHSSHDTGGSQNACVCTQLEAFPQNVNWAAPTPTLFLVSHLQELGRGMEINLLAWLFLNERSRTAQVEVEPH